MEIWDHFSNIWSIKDYFTKLCWYLKTNSMKYVDIYRLFHQYIVISNPFQKCMEILKYFQPFIKFWNSKQFQCYLFPFLKRSLQQYYIINSKPFQYNMLSLKYHLSHIVIWNPFTAICWHIKTISTIYIQLKAIFSHIFYQLKITPKMEGQLKIISGFFMHLRPIWQELVNMKQFQGYSNTSKPFIIDNQIEWKPFQ